MDIFKVNSPEELLKGNSYPGRGIVIGTTPDGKKAAAAYFIMGRSENSRNRIFAMENGALFTRAYDETKVKDPSLIIYPAMRRLGDKIIVTNGDQTDTVLDGLKTGKSFSEALYTRCFEPDAPNFTPRISGLVSMENGKMSYELSILKSADELGSACCRYFFSYPSIAGVGHLIHTYVCDGSPLPSFCGEPKPMEIPQDIDELAERLWQSLDSENKISLYVGYTDIAAGESEYRIINKNK